MRKWHRYLGIWTALLVLMLSITGILLVHKKEFGLNRVMVRLPGGTSPADAEPWQIISINDGTVVATKQGVYIQQGKEWTRTLPVAVRSLKQIEGRLYAATRDGLYESDNGGLEWLHHLSSHDVRAVEYDKKQLLVATTTGIHTRAGSDVQWNQLGDRFKKPLDVREIAHIDGTIRLVAKEGLFRLNNGTLKKEKLLLPAGASEPMELQKLITDLHNGKLGGVWLITAVDLTALGLIFLTVSGIWIWWVPRRKRLQKGLHT
ncbi:MAG: PepSY-associated TM helix domain-containing protein [Desulfuromonadaceae bacterium]